MPEWIRFRQTPYNNEGFRMMTIILLGVSRWIFRWLSRAISSAKTTAIA